MSTARAPGLAMASASSSLPTLSMNARLQRQQGIAFCFSFGVQLAAHDHAVRLELPVVR